MADERPFFRLVDKLRLLASSEEWTSAFGEAADCIEALGAENARLRRALDVMTRDLLETKSRLGVVGALKTERDLWRNETWKHDGIVSELEAENKRLKEQLVYMAKLYADETAQDSKPIVRDLLGHDWDG